MRKITSCSPGWVINCHSLSHLDIFANTQSKSPSFSHSTWWWREMFLTFSVAQRIVIVSCTWFTSQLCKATWATGQSVKNKPEKGQMGAPPLLHPVAHAYCITLRPLITSELAVQISRDVILTQKKGTKPKSGHCWTPWGGISSGSFLITSSLLKHQQYRIHVNYYAGRVRWLQAGCK